MRLKMIQTKLKREEHEALNNVSCVEHIPYRLI